MADRYVVEPDVGFIEEIAELGGQDIKKCFQCATCSVACPISPETRPFPRKEMIAGSWGLKDKIVGNADIWLCHNCGDCTSLCPRGAKPGDVLGAMRAYAVSEYASPKVLAKAVNDPKKVYTLLAIPLVLFFIVGQVLNWVNDKFHLIHGSFLDMTPDLVDIAHWKFINTWLIDAMMVPTALFMLGVFALGLKRFLTDIHKNALLEGKTDKEKIEPLGFIQALIKVIPTILKHNKFNECGENKERSTAHMLVFFSFVGLLLVTTYAFLSLYVFPQVHGPIAQINPIKWLANITGVALVVGGWMMISSRKNDEEQQSAYKDWALLYLVFGLGVTGMGAEITRLLGWGVITYIVYALHIILVWSLVAYLPFSKLAHIVYRTVAMAYAEYSNRK